MASQVKIKIPLDHVGLLPYGFPKMKTTTPVMLCLQEMYYFSLKGQFTWKEYEKDLKMCRLFSICCSRATLPFFLPLPEATGAHLFGLVSRFSCTIVFSCTQSMESPWGEKSRKESEVGVLVLGLPPCRLALGCLPGSFTPFCSPHQAALPRNPFSSPLQA